MEEKPKDTKDIESYFDFNDLWYKLSRNSRNREVFSCPDAAANRMRLCNDDEPGIPIFDELKTELGYFIDKNKKQQKVLVHCRGNQKVDRLKISNILNAEYQRIENKGVTKGLINPFGVEFRDLLQIFDISTVKQFHPPYTMMTNAGDYKLGIEFYPKELISVLNHTIVDDIIRKDNYNNFIKHKIGIVTGNGPDSGMLLWRKINNAVKDNLSKRKKLSFSGDLSFPEISIESIPEMGISMELEDRLKATELVVLKSVINLCKNGATLICLACNTTQYFKQEIEELCDIYNVEFLSIPEVLEEYLVKSKIDSFDFIGISYVADFEKYSAYKYLNNKFSISVNQEVLKDIDKLAFVIKMFPDNYQKIQPLGKILEQKTINDTVVVALTEISTVLDYHKKLVKSKNIIDTVQVLADEVAKRYIKGIYNTLFVDEYKENTGFLKLENEISKDVKNQIWKILQEIDYEFIPPLSYRESTTDQFENDNIETENLQPYFDGLLEQKIIVSKKKASNRITGFMSYKPNYQVVSNKEHSVTNKEISFSSHYISTIGVTKGARGNGITRMFYKEIEKEVAKSKENNWVSTRTWSTNITHIRILESLGYENIIEIKNDRGAGIHTIYYAKQIFV